MSEGRPEWDDARLDAAFEHRARVATPAGVTEAVLERIESRRAQSSVTPWLAAAAGVALLVGIAGAFGLQPGPRVPPTGASMTPGSSGSVRATTTLAPPDRLGDPIDVAAAIAVRDGTEPSDRELSVAGFLSPLPALPCPAIFGPRNPTRIQCPESFQWLMADPEIVMSGGNGGPPKGLAIHPSFALVDAPDVPIAASGAAQPIPVVLIGHFHDRRAALCPPRREGEADCKDTFVVDQVAAVSGEPRGVVTRLRNERFDDATRKQVTEQPSDLQEDVDQLAIDQVPGGTMLSRQLVTIDHVIGIEPVLANDDFVPYVGNPATLVWIVTVGDLHADPVVARTFVLFDGSDWFAEIRADGAHHLDRTGSGPPPNSSGAPPSADPTAFDRAPTSVLGIPVRDIATVMRDRRAVMDDLGRDEMAIRAWYIAPDPAATCDEPVPAIHPPEPPCDAARHWLVDDPSAFGTEVGQMRREPEHWPRALNPILPVDVPFPVPSSWIDGRPSPQPVIVLGHFEDVRVQTRAGNVYFVVDALAWTRGDAIASIDHATSLTAAATEDPASVVARIAAVSRNEAVATWTTVVDADVFTSFEGYNAEDAREFWSGPPVWIVRRLVPGEMDGRRRLAVETGYTADHGTRVWLTETPDSQADLATSIDLRNVDGRTPLVRVFDYEQQIERVTTTDGLGTLSWKSVGPDPVVGLKVARGRSNREIAVRWSGGACDTSWEIRVRNLTDGRILVEPGALHGTCERDGAVREIVLRFDRAVDLDRIRTGDPCCG